MSFRNHQNYHSLFVFSPRPKSTAACLKLCLLKLTTFMIRSSYSYTPKWCIFAQTGKNTVIQRLFSQDLSRSCNILPLVTITRPGNRPVTQPPDDRTSRHHSLHTMEKYLMRQKYSSDSAVVIVTCLSSVNENP